MGLALVDNVRGFFVSRPPLVVFMICLGSFAVALITFAYIIKVKDMRNPDVIEDWNDFLDGMASLDFCVVSAPGETGSSNASGTSRPASNEKLHLALQRVPDKLNQIMGSEPSVQGGSRLPSTTTTAATAIGSERLVNVSVLIDVELHALKTLVNVTKLNNYTAISTLIQGHHFGFTDRRKSMDANVTLMLPSLGNQTTDCLNGPSCYSLKYVCATLIAPASFFPRTKRPDVEETCERDPDSWNNHLHLDVTPDWRQCRNASFLHLMHQYDPSLTVMLTMQDRSVINLHLMHTSYFLFVMMVTLFCYAIVKGRPTKVKVVYTQCTSDKSMTQA